MTLEPDATDPPERPGGQLQQVAAFGRRLWRLSGGRAPGILLLHALGGVTNGISILLLVPVLSMISRDEGGVRLDLDRIAFLDGILPQGLVTLPMLLTGIVLLVILGAALGRTSLILSADALVEIINEMRLRLARDIARANWAAVSRRRQADLTHILTGEIDRIQSAATSMVNLSQSLLTLVIYLGASLLVSPVMTAVTAGIGVLSLALLAPIRRRANRVGRQMTHHRKAQYGLIEAFLSGMRVAKSMNAESRTVAALQDILSTMRRDQARLMNLGSIGGFGFRVVTAIGLAVFVYVSVSFTRLPIAEIVVLLIIFTRIGPIVISIEALLRDILQNLPAADAMEEEARYFADAAEPRQTGPGLPRPVDAVELERVGYAYGAEGRALANVDLTARIGWIVAITGPSGSGKSTLADILSGLIAPDEGRMRVDGRDLVASDLHAWREHVSLVHQADFLVHATIAENLRLSRPDATGPELRSALDRAQASDFVDRLPQGIDTIVGERGTRLSGGERQRISLARALLRGSAVYVLDEATSALDHDNQIRIAATVRTLAERAAVIAITHQPAFLTMADEVITLENGVIVEAGARRDLLADPASRLSVQLAKMRGEDGDAERPFRRSPDAGADPGTA